MAERPDFSILDLVPVSEGETGADALRRAGDLATSGEQWGYKRIWYAEHHGMPAIASSSPEVLIAHAAARTNTIRVGSGGVMLPNHAALRITETYATLAGLYPDRIDLGLGRAGGTDQRTMQALNSVGGEYFPYQIAEMLGYAEGVAPKDHPHEGVRLVPDGVPLPPVFILGSSGASAEFAGQHGFGYGFAAHFSDAPPKPAFDAYRRAFRPGAAFTEPRAILCLSVICADTEEEARFQGGTLKLNWRNLARGMPERLQSPEAAAAFPFSEAEERHLNARTGLVITGTGESVRDRALARAHETGADEVMIATTLFDHADRLKSYRLLAEALGLAPGN